MTQREWIVLGVVVAGIAAAAGLAAGVIGCITDNRPRSEPATHPTGLVAPSILVEKSAHRLTLLDQGRAVKVYRAAVGGGKGDKVREGDRCTPEGQFCVCYKNPQSKYVLSMGLNYPNEEDAHRGLRDGLIDRAQYDAIVTANRTRSVDPNLWEKLWKTPLGGEIMIHGSGAGRDWTLGCVALADDDIRELYGLIPLGTAVEIKP